MANYSLKISTIESGYMKTPMFGLINLELIIWN